MKRSVVEHCGFLPTISRKPIPGSRWRILTYDGATAVGEGKKIGKKEPVPGR